MSECLSIYRFVIVYKEKGTENIIAEHVTYRSKKRANEQARLLTERGYGEVVGVFKVLVCAEVK